MKSSINSWLLSLRATALLLAICTGCGPRAKSMPSSYLSTMRQSGKASIAKYTWKPHQDSYMDSLSDKSIAAIEAALMATKNFPYSTVGLSMHGPGVSSNTDYYMELEKSWDVTAIIELELRFGVKPIFKKCVVVSAAWTIRSPDGKTTIELDDTEAEADKAEEVFPSVTDPRYEATFVKLATDNAMQFLNFFQRS
jgi:hypothetical protein